MDARLPRLEAIRARKAEATRLRFVLARREFGAAERHSEMLRQRRIVAGRQVEVAASAEMESLAMGAPNAQQISAVHEGDERRRAALAALDREIASADAERERLRAIAAEMQRLYHLARRTSEKLGLMVGKLQQDENSLHMRMIESRNDSAIRDAITGRWKLQQTDT